MRYAQKFKWVWSCHLIAVHPLARPLWQEMLPGLELPFNSGSPPSPTPLLARDASGRFGDFITLPEGGGEGRAGWWLEGIVQGLVELSEQNSNVSKTQIEAPGKFKTKTQFPSNLSSSAPAYGLQQIKRLQHQTPLLVSDTSLYL